MVGTTNSNSQGNLDGDKMKPDQALDRFLLRKIEQQLTAEIQTAREQALKSSTEEEKFRASEALERALRRFADFAGQGIVPEEFLRRAEG
jgi:hypothetical protein